MVNPESNQESPQRTLRDEWKPDPLPYQLRPPRRVSWFAMFLGVTALLAGILCLGNPEGVQRNVNMREGMHKMLGQPETPYSLHGASALFIFVQGLLLLARSLFAPSLSQTVATAIGGFAISIVLVNVVYGQVDPSLTFFLLVALACLLFDLKCFLKARRLRNRPATIFIDR